MEKLALFIVFLILILITGCRNAPPEWKHEKTEKIENIVTTFMNKENDYTVFVKKDNQLVPVKLESISGSLYQDNPVKIFTDVPHNQLMWAKKETYINVNYDKSDAYDRRLQRVDIELHIHSEVNLRGGEWSEKLPGKHPKTITGKVNKVE